MLTFWHYDWPASFSVRASGIAPRFHVHIREASFSCHDLAPVALQLANQSGALKGLASLVRCQAPIAQVPYPTCCVLTCPGETRDRKLGNANRTEYIEKGREFLMTAIPLRLAGCSRPIMDDHRQAGRLSGAPSPRSYVASDQPAVIS